MDIPTDPLANYRAAIMAALRLRTGVAVYDGEVPDDIPEDEAGFIEPYVVLFSGDGDALPETDLSGRVDTAGLRWDFQTTSVGASPAVCSAVARNVRLTLTNFPLGTYHVLPSPMALGVSAPLKDTDTTPARFFLPREWRLDTT